MRWWLLVFAIGCHNEQPRTTVGAGTATEFWCAPNGECFTERDRCAGLGECVVSPTAWCSQGAMGGYRFICARDKTRCEELALASREQFTNACAAMGAK